MGRVVQRALLVVIVLAVIGVIAWEYLAPEVVGGGATPSASAVPGRPDDAFRLTVTYVFDGDTIEARAEQPGPVVDTTDPVRIRLIGIDTPEGTPTVECWADEARAHLARLLPEGATVWAAADNDYYDDYGRVLLYLWTTDGVFVNHQLVATGDAEAIRVRPNEAHYDLFVEAQQAAEAARLGQWGSC